MLRYVFLLVVVSFFGERIFIHTVVKDGYIQRFYKKDMILTVTLNPAVDTRYFIKNYSERGVFRPEKTIKEPGGKGLNVTKVLHQLGAEVAPTGIAGGYNGQWIIENLRRFGIHPQFLFTEAESRVCIAVIHDNGVSEILESGENVSAEDLSRFEEHFCDIIIKCSVVTMSGSLSKGIPEDYYAKLINIADNAGVRTILDTSGNPLLKSLKSRPYIIKPNKHELAAVAGKKIVSEEDILEAGKMLMDKGAENILVSTGSAGGYYLSRSYAHRIKIPEVQTANPVGSGDASVAGLAYGVSLNMPVEEALKISMACGISNAQSERTGYVIKDDVLELAKQITTELIY